MSNTKTLFRMTYEILSNNGSGEMIRKTVGTQWFDCESKAEQNRETAEREAIDESTIKIITREHALD